MKRSFRRGFSLIESAVVLAIVGLVIGGIWVAAATIRRNMIISEMSTGIAQIMEGVRQLYKGQALPAMGSDISATVIGAGISPPAWNVGSTISLPHTGVNLQALVSGVNLSPGIGTSFTGFGITFVTFNKEDCSRFRQAVARLNYTYFKQGGSGCNSVILFSPLTPPLDVATINGCGSSLAYSCLYFK